MADLSRYLDTLAQLNATINAPWESVAMTLEQHPIETLGDLGTEGTAAWHLGHIAAIFRKHAECVVGKNEIQSWPAMPETLPEILRTLKADCERFARWCSANPDRCVDVDYGGDQSFSQMLGIMLRHIIWHAAAAHYWCLWRG